MNARLVLLLITGVILAGLVYFSYSTYGDLQVALEVAKNTKAELVALEVAKKKSDEAVAQLTIDLLNNQVETTKYITKLVKVPVSADEKCVSPVLREALKEND